MITITETRLATLVGSAGELPRHARDNFTKAVSRRLGEAPSDDELLQAIRDVLHTPFKGGSHVPSH